MLGIFFKKKRVDYFMTCLRLLQIKSLNRTVYRIGYRMIDLNQKRRDTLRVSNF